jgi:hypothetical protein
MKNEMPLKMYITDKDLETLKFVERFGSITTKQCGKLFYNNQVYCNQTANKKLNKLVRYGKLKVYKDIQGNENVYYFDKKLSYHDLLSLDFYSQLVNLGVHIYYFERNKGWIIDEHTKKPIYISDAYCCYGINNKLFFNIIEVVRTHGLDKEKYIDIYNSNEPQNLCNEIYSQLGGSSLNVFPKIILIDNTEHTEGYSYIDDNIEVIQLDFKLNNFSQIFS